MTGSSPDSPLPPDKRHGAGQYEMLWDCKFCGTQKLLGVTHRHCPSCGAAQDPEQRYFPAEEDMVALSDHKYVGADVMCPACGQPNSAANAFCAECGADLSTGQKVATAGERVIGTGRAESDTRRDVVKDKHEAEMARIDAEEKAQPVFLGLTKGQLWAIVGLVIVVAIIGGIIFALTYREESDGEVTAMTWERQIAIEDFQPREQESWDDDMPGDAYAPRCEPKKKDTERVEVGTEEQCRDVDLANGGMERVCEDVPVYEDRDVMDDWCTYTIDRWDVVRTESASGASKDDPAPDWPPVTLAEGDGRFGAEREGAKSESYKVVVRVKGDDQTCGFETQSEWDAFDIGTKVKLELRVGGDADCDTLKIVDD